MMIVSNFMFQLQAIITPLNPTQRTVNIYYTLLSFFVSFLQLISYTSKQRTKIVLPVLYIITCRQVFRTLDFEQTGWVEGQEEQEGRLSKGDWSTIAFGQTFNASVCIVLLIYMFSYSKLHFLFVQLVTFFLACCLRYYSFGSDEFLVGLVGFIMQNIIFLISLVGILFLNASANDDYFKQTDKIIQAQSKFKHIFDNLDEPVVIIKTDQAQYVNGVFLKLFKQNILKA